MLSRHVLTVSDFQILIESCSIESRNDLNPKSEVVHETKFSLKIYYSTHDCLKQLNRHQTCKTVMVSAVSLSPTGGNFIFLRHLNANFVQKCQKSQSCVIYENLDYMVRWPKASWIMVIWGLAAGQTDIQTVNSKRSVKTFKEISINHVGFPTRTTFLIHQYL